MCYKGRKAATDDPRSSLSETSSADTNLYALSVLALMSAAFPPSTSASTVVLGTGPIHTIDATKTKTKTEFTESDDPVSSPTNVPAGTPSLGDPTPASTDGNPTWSDKTSEIGAMTSSSLSVAQPSHTESYPTMISFPTTASETLSNGGPIPVSPVTGMTRSNSLFTTTSEVEATISSSLVVTNAGSTQSDDLGSGSTATSLPTLPESGFAPTLTGTGQTWSSTSCDTTPGPEASTENGPTPALTSTGVTGISWSKTYSNTTFETQAFTSFVTGAIQPVSLSLAILELFPPDPQSRRCPEVVSNPQRLSRIRLPVPRRRPIRRPLRPHSQSVNRPQFSRRLAGSLLPTAHPTLHSHSAQRQQVKRPPLPVLIFSAQLAAHQASARHVLTPLTHLTSLMVSLRSLRSLRSLSRVVVRPPLLCQQQD